MLLALQDWVFPSQAPTLILQSHLWPPRQLLTPFRCPSEVMATSGDRKPQFWCAEVMGLVTVRGPSHSNKNKPHRVGTSPAESRETPTTTTALPLVFVSPRTPKNTQNICPSSAESFRLPYLRSPVPQQNCWRMIRGRQRGAPPKAASPRTSLWSTKFLQDDPPLPALRITGAGLQPRGCSTPAWCRFAQQLRVV